jgi:DNA-binding MarR family transcriptional regulator
MQLKPKSNRTGDRVARAADGMRRIVQALRLSTHAIEKKLGISGAQVFVMQQLSLSGGLSLRDLAARTRTDPSSVSVAVSRLEAKGLVRRLRAAADGRRAELWLSPKGEAVLRRAPEPAQAKLIRALEGLPPERLSTLVLLLNDLAEQLGAPRGVAPMFFEESAAGVEKSGGRRARA